MSLFQKMVLGLPPEFFEGWEWNAGDKAILIDDHYKRTVIVINTTPQIYTQKLERAELLYPGSMNQEFITEAFDRLRPLPSQKQLQSMLDLSPINFIEDLYEYAQEPLLPGMDTEQFETDMECFTLAYVMDRTFKIYWDGEKWRSSQ